MGTAQYDEATRQRALRLYYEAIAEDGTTKSGTRRKIGGILGIKPTPFHNWICKAEAAGGEATTQTEQEKDTELNQLRRGNEQLKQANEIVKLASAFRPSAARPQTKIIVDFCMSTGTYFLLSGCVRLSRTKSTKSPLVPITATLAADLGPQT